MSRVTDLHLYGHRYGKKTRGGAMDQKTSKYLVRPALASCSGRQLLHMEIIRLLAVGCGMLVFSSSMAVQSFWKFAGTGTRCHTH